MTETADLIYSELVNIVTYYSELHNAHIVRVKVVIVTVPVVVIYVVFAVLWRVACEAGSSGSGTCRFSIGGNACGSLIICSLEGWVSTSLSSSLYV